MPDVEEKVETKAPEIRTESRVFTREDATALASDIVKEVSHEVAEQIRESMAKATEKIVPSEAVKDLTQPERDRPVQPGAHTARYEKEKSLAIGAMVRCTALARQFGRQMSDVVREQYGEGHPVTKTLLASNFTAGGSLVEDEVSAEVIEFLRATAVVERAGPRRMPLDRGTVDMPKLTGGASGGWLGEGSNITKTEQTTGQVNLTAHFYGSVVPISNQLLEFATPDVDAMVRDDMVGDIAAAVDLAFLNANGTASQPKGLRYLAGNTINANVTQSLATVTTETGQAIRTLMDNNVNLTSGAWFWAPRTWQYFFTVLDSNGHPAFRDEIERGRLFNFPFYTTSQIPINITFSAANQSYVLFCNMPDVVTGQTSSVQVAASSEAAYYDGSNVQAAFSRNETVIRAIIGVDINVRHAESVVLIDRVEWGSGS
jgi:HK97 family phage major capsid protein